MTEEEVHQLLAIPNKLIIRRMEWAREMGGHSPPWFVFESAIQIGMQQPEGLRFRARYRPPKNLSKGGAHIKIGENFNVALFANTRQRIVAIDTNPGQRHFNRVGSGRAYFEQTVVADTHRHIWTGQYGYVEPIEPSLLDVVQLLEYFAQEYNLAYTGCIVHPRKGEQGVLL